MLKLLVGPFTEELSSKPNWFIVNSVAFVFCYSVFLPKYMEKGVGKGFIKLICTQC